MEDAELLGPLILLTEAETDALAVSPSVSRRGRILLCVDERQRQAAAERQRERAERQRQWAAEAVGWMDADADESRVLQSGDTACRAMGS